MKKDETIILPIRDKDCVAIELKLDTMPTVIVNIFNN